MPIHHPLGLVARAILVELAKGELRTVVELFDALRCQRHEATLATVYSCLDRLRDHQMVDFVTPTSEEADEALADAARIARRFSGEEDSVASHYEFRFVLTEKGRQSLDSSR